MARSKKEEFVALTRVTQAQLNLADHHYIVLSHLHPWIHELAERHASGVLFDFGCGGRQYESLFAPRLERYIAADVVAAVGVKLDVVLTPGEPVPMESGSADCVLSTQVLEHVPDPFFYVSEAARLLKPGGRFFLSAPMHWRHHEIPHDYFRFTRYGIQALLERAGLEPVEIRPSGGQFAVLGQSLLDHLSEYRSRYPLIFRPGVIRVLNRLFTWLDRRYPDDCETINWLCLSRKPV
jgi:SAM-dependent methyltransferase